MTDALRFASVLFRAPASSCTPATQAPLILVGQRGPIIRNVGASLSYSGVGLDPGHVVGSLQCASESGACGVVRIKISGRNATAFHSKILPGQWALPILSIWF